MRIQASRRRLALAMAILGVTAIGGFWSKSQVLAQGKTSPAPQTKTATPPAAPSDYCQRVVAYIYDTIPITREDLGEYLIARMPEDRLNNLVNKRIIDHYCQQKGIEVTAAEVEADFAETLKGLNVTAKEFESKVLKPHGKSLYEWREDVIKPRILLSKLCRDRIKVTDQDLQTAFEAYFGEKVDCRIILWPKGEQKIAMNMYGKIRDSEEEFDRASRSQASQQLASTGGHIAPIGRHTTGNEALERAAFSLRKGELSQLIDTPEGPVVIKCVDRLPADASKKLSDVREQLTKEVVSKKVQLEIPKMFNELREKAQPRLIYKHTLTESELLRDVQQELRSSADTVPHSK